MKRKSGKVIAASIALLMVVGAFSGCGNNNSNNNKEPINNSQNDQQETPKVDAVINGAEDVSIQERSEFDPLAGITATGTDGKDATSMVKVSGEVDTFTPGDYELTYKVADLSVKRVVTVKGIQAVFANGVYNYKFASPDVRHTFMAAAEDYLLHNQYAGIPLNANAGFSMYSSRMQLASEKHLPVLGFGVRYSTMAADDSKVIMEDGKPGKEGEYTYRIAATQNPSQWSQWKSDDSVTSDLMDFYYGRLYDYEFKEDKSGYVLAPSLADGYPIPVDSETLPSGKVVSKKWRIKVKEGLQWKFNDKTDTSMVTDTTINAVDFYESFKIALTEKWFRAISGGGDFCTSTKEIVNAQNFVDGLVPWEEVGIKLIDDYTFEYEFVDDQSEWDVKYFSGDTSLTPIHTELYEALGDKFGIDEKSIAYSGPYYVDYYESDKVVRMKKNELFHDSDKYFYTGRNIYTIDDAEMRFQEFVAGKLDAVGLPSAHYDEYKDQPGVKRVPGATTFRMMVNGLKNREGQLKQFPESEWTPEPILSDTDFKMGLYHAIDRKKLAEEVMKTSQTQMYLFTDAYVVEAETGIPYRNTPQGKAVGKDLSPSTYGYNLDAARAYYEKAVDKFVEDGTYKDGDEITFEFYHQSGSETLALMGAYIKDAIEEAFQSEKHNINVKVDVIPKDFPGIYYDHLMIGEFDTGSGGIAGSTLDAASFLDTFCSDNRGGFTLNWGIDTTIPEITITYENDGGELVKELWSYDALVSALNGEVKVHDGIEVVEEETEEEAAEE